MTFHFPIPKYNFSHSLMPSIFAGLVARLRSGVPGLLSLLLVTGSLGGCYAIQSSTDYYGLQTTGENIVFLIDVSGSMEGKQEGTAEDQLRGTVATEAGKQVQNLIGGTIGQFVGQQVRSEATKLGAAKRELIPAIRGLGESNYFSIVTFGSNIDPWHQQMIPASPSAKNAAMLRINQLSAQGGTPMLAALEQGFQYRGATTIFVMTDGKPTDSSAARIIQRVSELNRDGAIKVNTIGLGPDQDASFLATLAQQNGGHYISRR